MCLAPTAGEPPSGTTSHRMPRCGVRRQEIRATTLTIAAATKAMRHERTIDAVRDRLSRSAASIDVQIASGASIDGRCSTIDMPNLTCS